MSRPLTFLLLFGPIIGVLPTDAILAQGYPPAEAAGKMQTPEGFSVKLVASEPEIRQPILVKYDDRGRLWVIQYLQYPNPAGLKRVKVDRWSRTVYDRVPEPPPKGPRGADRITILEDTDGDGRADKFKDFLTGLNLATGLAFGHGGVYVLQAPYLLFYADRDRNDVPDGDPEVLLTGFGMEDAQSLANHLTWGPDGWLYGVSGSTTTSRIRDIEFQQGVWRFHPLTKEFELFCEGGGNLFGLTFDEHGQLFYSSNGGLFWHAMQGAYYEKNFGKHGPLHNPYAYGYLKNVEHVGVTGRPTTGGTIYTGESFPSEYHGAFICGDFLSHTCSWWQVRPRGSTVAATLGGIVLDSRDTWFCATDMCLAPDGSMVVCDFHDQRTAHPDPDAKWDTSNGRVYRIEYKGTKPAGQFDLSKKTSRELVDMLASPNGWFADQARSQLAARRDPEVIGLLRERAIQDGDSKLALQSLWGLYVSGGFDEAIAEKLLDHASEDVRAWTVRLIGDARKASAALAGKMATLAKDEKSVIVRAQLAATARRLPGKPALAIIEKLLGHKEDVKDPHVPWLLWWAIESHVDSNGEELAKVFRANGREFPGKNKLWTDNRDRLIRRFAAMGTKRGYELCLTLPTTFPAERDDQFFAALDMGLAERAVPMRGVEHGGLFQSTAGAEHERPVAKADKFEPLPPDFAEMLESHWRQRFDDTVHTRLAIRAGSDLAYRHVLAIVSEGKSKDERVLWALSMLAELGRDDCVPVVLKHLSTGPSEKVQLAALGVLARHPSNDVTSQLLADYAKLSPAVQSRVRDLLFSRPDSAKALLALIESKQIPAASVPIEQVRRIALHDDKDLDALVRKHWGNVQPGTPEDKLAVMRRLANDLRAGSGDPGRGKALFVKHCGTCHKLFGEGGAVGPDLTPTSRADQEYLLANLVDPSAVVRSQYLTYVVTTTGGVVETGLLAEQDAGSVTLLNAKGEKNRFPRDTIDNLKESAASLMPERLAESLSPQELRDLFRYLQAK